MKKAIALFISVIALFASCDKINDPVTETVTPIPVDTTDTNVVQKYRIVMLEEFTGHKCPNCPAAAKLLYNTIVPKYGKQLITMAVHAGTFANAYPGTLYTDDFKTPEGNTYDDNAHFNMSALGEPNAMINRTGYPGNNVNYSTAWDSKINSLYSVPPDAWITVANTYNNATRNVNIKVNTEFLNSLTGNYKLCVAITEDSINATQYDPAFPVPHDDTTYVHRHMFRGTVNTAFGELVAADPAAASTIEKNYLYTVPANFNEKQCYIVAYIYNATTFEIIQAGEAKIEE